MRSVTDPDLIRQPGFQAAVAALRAGRSAEAEALALAMLRDHPAAPDLHHLLGVIALRAGDHAGAADRLGQALALAPDSPAILFDAAIADGKRGRHDAALERLDRVLAQWPEHAESWVNRGHALRARERYDQAIDSFDRALALRPGLPEALHGRAHALAALDRTDAALLAYDRALAVRPTLTEAWVGKGNVLVKLDRPLDGLACFDRAVALGGSAEALAQAHHFRGDALRSLERLDDALASFDQAVAIAPSDADAWIGRGRVLLEMHDFHEALASYDRAVALRPDDPKPHDHRSRALRELGDYGAALTAAEESLRLRPDDTGGLNSRANALRMVGRVEEALADYARAIVVSSGAVSSGAGNPGEGNPGQGNAGQGNAGRSNAGEGNASGGPLRFNHAVCLLLAGDYKLGWPEYEHRWSLQSMARRRPRFHQPVWLGREDIAGRRILLHAEQGLGDTIQFCRYAPMVAALGATVILGVQPELRPLLADLPGVADVVDRTAAPPVFEYCCPLMSLPYALGTTLDTVPADIPYLRAPAGHVVAWRERLSRKVGPRVGLVWSGNRDHRNDHNRSIPLAMLDPVLAQAPMWHCLQKDVRPEDVPALAMGGVIRFHGPELADFGDTAALVAAMDLVITVDTAVAHLAGALGRPVWLLLPYAPDWRWMLGRDTTPWYPTTRLFRQTEAGDWAPVLRRVADALSQFVADRNPGVR